MSTASYDRMTYRRAGRSGLVLPAISLGLWQGTGSYADEQATRAIILTAFERGIIHLDLANNYGNPAGMSETVCGRIIRELPRHELVLSSKAGYRMWPGPHGEGGSRKYLIESCEQSLRRLGVDHLDIFYSHRLDRDTPLEETLGALDQLVRQGKTHYAAVSNWPEPWFSQGITIAQAHRLAPITLHQPRYSLLDRTPEAAVLPTAQRHGVGVAVFSPLAQGQLTGKYLEGIPADSRIALGQGNGALRPEALTPQSQAVVRGLAAIAAARGEPLARMALAWVLRDPRVTTAIIGASRPEQVMAACDALASPPFTPEQLAAIDALTAP